MRERMFSINLLGSEVACVSPGGPSNNSDLIPKSHDWTDRQHPESNDGHYAEAGGMLSGVVEAVAELQWDGNRPKCNPVPGDVEFASRTRQHAKDRRLSSTLARALL